MSLPGRLLDGYVRGPAAATEATARALAKARPRTPSCWSRASATRSRWRRWPSAAAGISARKGRGRCRSAALTPSRVPDAVRSRRADLSLAGLCDLGEERRLPARSGQAGIGSPQTRADMERLGFYVCVEDLEDELIRAVGAAGSRRSSTRRAISARSAACSDSRSGGVSPPKRSCGGSWAAAPRASSVRAAARRGGRPGPLPHPLDACSRASARGSSAVAGSRRRQAQPRPADYEIDLSAANAAVPRGAGAVHRRPSGRRASPGQSAPLRRRDPGWTAARPGPARTNMPWQVVSSGGRFAPGASRVRAGRVRGYSSRLRAAGPGHELPPARSPHDNGGSGQCPGAAVAHPPACLTSRARPLRTADIRAASFYVQLASPS